jgi:3-phenylpropionate/trans-cinnamate dioxygenase ferredoxin component
LPKQHVGKVDDIPPGKMMGVEADRQKMLVANVGGQFFAMRSVCNHMGGPLEKGSLVGNVVTCPLHGSQWDVMTGELVKFNRQLPSERTYKVTVADGQVFIES